MLSAEQKEKIADYLERNWFRNNNGRLCKIVLNSNGKHEYPPCNRDQENTLIYRINVRVLKRKHAREARNEVISCISETLGLQSLPYNTDDIVAQTRKYMSAPPAKRKKSTAPGVGDLDAIRKHFGDKVDRLCVGQKGGGVVKKRKR